MNPSAPTPDDLQGATGRIRRLIRRQKDDFEGNERLPELMAACAIAQEPLWLIGGYGTAKTTMSARFFEGLGLTPGKANGYFEKSLHPYTEPAEIFGPLDFQRLTATQANGSQYYRLTDGYLPKARAAFVDEFSQAPPELLLTLLHILQHRTFHNGRELEASPLAIVFTASNEIPSNRRLGALFNRLPLRIVAEDIQDAKSRARVLKKSVDLWLKAPGQSAATSEPICSFSDFETALAAIRQSDWGDLDSSPTLVKYVELMHTLGAHGDEIAVTNPRTQLKVLLVMRALALLRRGDPRPQLAELRVLEHIFEQPEHQEVIATELEQGRIPPWEPIPNGSSSAAP